MRKDKSFPSEFPESEPPNMSHENTPLLTKFPSLQKISQSKECNKRKVIFCEGDKGEFIYYLISGVMVSYKVTASGQLRILQFFLPESFIGNITLFNELEYNMTLEAFEICRYLKFNKRQLKQLVLEEPRILMSMYQDLSTKLTLTSEIIINNFLTVEERIIKSLLLLCQNCGLRTEEGILINLNLTQDELARLAGTTRVTVTKLLSDLSKQGILRTKPKPWIIFKIEKLLYFLNN